MIDFFWWFFKIYYGVWYVCCVVVWLVGFRYCDCNVGDIVWYVVYCWCEIFLVFGFDGGRSVSGGCVDCC